MAQKPIVINEWTKGVADSPYEGMGLMRNVDIESFPGSVKVSKKMYSFFTPSLSTIFTADAGTDVITLVSGSSPLSTGAAVTFTTSNTLPAGLVAGTVYFTIYINTTTFKVATTIANAEAGTPVDITDAGTGTHTVTTVNPGTIKHIIKDPNTSVYYLQDSNARVWFNDSSLIAKLLVGNTLTNGSGNGIVLFTNSNASATYLFAFRNAAIDVVNVFTSTNYYAPSWSNSWQALNTGATTSNSHFAKVGQDNIIYFCDAKYIGSIKELTTFDPATGGTYTYNSQALDLPQGEIAEWFDEMGVNLEIAGKNFNKIYPWDRISSTFNLPIIVPEYLIKKVINLGNYLYILVGTKGNVYRTQGSYVERVRKIPEFLVNNSVALTTNQVTWGGLATRSGALLIGVGGLTTGNSGVYMLYPDGRLIMDNMPSTGSANATAIFAESDFYLIGYASGADYMNQSLSSGSPAFYSSFETVINSGLYQVGDKTHKGKFSELQVQLGKPPTAAGHIRIKYRTDISSSFTDFATAISYIGNSSTTSFKTDVGLTDLENIQLQAEMDGDIELVSITLIP